MGGLRGRAQSEREGKAEGTVVGCKAPAAGHGGWWRNTGATGWGSVTGSERGMAPLGSWCESAAEGAGKCMGDTWAWSRPAEATMYQSAFSSKETAK